LIKGARTTAIKRKLQLLLATHINIFVLGTCMFFITYLFTYQFSQVLPTADSVASVVERSEILTFQLISHANRFLLVVVFVNV